MADPSTFASTLTSIRSLNETPLSRRLRKMLLSAKAEVSPDSLVLVSLLQWALEKMAADPAWAEAVREAALLAEHDNPETVYEALATPQLEKALSLNQAGEAVLSSAADAVNPGINPP